MAPRDPLIVGEFCKIPNMNKIDQGITFWGQNFFFFGELGKFGACLIFTS